MPEFSQRSKERLASCDVRLQRLMNEVVKRYDIAVLEGHRSNERQEALYRKGVTKARAGQSLHNSYPSMAVDVAPWPIDWNDIARFEDMATYVLGVAHGMGLRVRWGGTWTENPFDRRARFFDGPHFELVGD